MTAQSSARAGTRASAAEPVLMRENAGNIAILTLNRPSTRNTLSEAMLAALGDELTAIAKDRAVRAVVLAANGPAFSGGHDLKELTARRSDPDRGRAYFRHIMLTCSAMMQQIVRLPQPVIAAVQGHRHRGRLPIGGKLRPRGRIGRREIRRVGHQCRAVLLDARWSRSRATSRASTRWRCCSPAT